MAELNINFKDIVWTDVPDEVKKAFDFSLYNVEVKDGVAYVKKKEPDYPKTYKDCFYKVFENEENRYMHRSKLVMYDFTSSAKTISSGIPVLTEFEHLYKLLICRACENISVCRYDSLWYDGIFPCNDIWTYDKGGFGKYRA